MCCKRHQWTAEINLEIINFESIYWYKHFILCSKWCNQCMVGLWFINWTQNMKIENKEAGIYFCMNNNIVLMVTEFFHHLFDL